LFSGTFTPAILAIINPASVYVFDLLCR